VALELVGGEVAKELHAVAAFDESQALGDEALELDRADLGAILFLLAALLRDLVVVELAFDAIGGTVEEIDRGPQQALEIGLKARVAERRDQGVEDVCDRAADDIDFRQRSRVGLVLEGTMTIELELGEDVIGG
jgi:hypothetical protein